MLIQKNKTISNFLLCMTLFFFSCSKSDQYGMEQKGKDLGIKRPGEDLDKHGEKTIKFSTEDLPIGISSIVDMLSTPYYVDKTEHAYELLHGISKYIFLSRPRRFGKSLFVSTLEEIAKGNKELFKNCWIGKSN